MVMNDCHNGSGIGGIVVVEIMVDDDCGLLW